MKPLLLMLVASPAFAQLAPVAQPNETPWYVWPAVALVAVVVIFFVLKKKKPELAASISTAAGSAVGSVTDSLTSLLHKQADTQAAVVAQNTQLAAVALSPPAQALVNAGQIPAPTAAPAPVAAAPAIAVRASLLPGGTPVAELPLYQGQPRREEFVYPDEDDYRRIGNQPSWGWVEVLRTVNGVPPRRGATAPGNPGYVDGQANIVQATEEQKALARRINAHVTQEDVTAAYAELLASAGTMDRVNAIINAYSTSAS